MLLDIVGVALQWGWLRWRRLVLPIELLLVERDLGHLGETSPEAWWCWRGKAHALRISTVNAGRTVVIVLRNLGCVVATEDVLDQLASGRLLLLWCWRGLLLLLAKEGLRGSSYGGRDALSARGREILSRPGSEGVRVARRVLGLLLTLLLLLLMMMMLLLLVLLLLGVVMVKLGRHGGDLGIALGLGARDLVSVIVLPWRARVKCCPRDTVGVLQQMGGRRWRLLMA